MAGYCFRVAINFWAFTEIGASVVAEFLLLETGFLHNLIGVVDKLFNVFNFGIMQC